MEPTAQILLAFDISINLKYDLDNGLYFGNKNNFVENQNILISGNISKEEILIRWEIEKIK